jgi:hypothetical protein
LAAHLFRPATGLPAVAARQHFYLILSGQSHGAKKPHYTFISAVRAFVPPNPAARSEIAARPDHSRPRKKTGPP